MWKEEREERKGRKGGVDRTGEITVWIIIR
jgi:hypothetical protein